jgi:hypothetical protein
MFTERQQAATLEQDLSELMTAVAAVMETMAEPLAVKTARLTRLRSRRAHRAER